MTQASRGKAKRAAIYVRRSIDDGDATCSLPEQERACRDYAEGIGPVVRVFKENMSGVSGFDRPVFQGMIAAAGRREFDAIVCLDVSRFGRFDVHEQGYWLTALKRSNVEVRFVHDDSRLAGEAGPIMGAVLQQSAREHSIKTALRVTMGHIACVERGCWQGGPPPFGYRLVRREGWNGAGRRDSKLVVHEPEANIVREIFRLYSSGKGTPAICKVLNRNGWWTKTGGAWDPGTIRALLSNPVYKGDIVRSRKRRSRSRPSGSKASQFYHGSSKGVVPVGGGTDGYGNAGAAPPIVGLDLWNRVQEVADERSTTATGGKPGVFAGLARCGACHGVLNQRHGSTTKGMRYSYLGCRNYRMRGLDKSSSGDCARVSVRTQALLERTLEILREEAAKIDAAGLADELKKRLAIRITSVDIAALETKRKRLAARRRELLLGDSEFEKAGFAELTAEDERILREIEKARHARASAPDVDAMVASVLEAARALQTPATARGEEAFKKAFRTFVAQIEVAPSERKAPKPIALTIYGPEGAAFTASESILGRT